MQTGWLLVFGLLQCGKHAQAIVNPNQHSANMVIYMRKPSELDFQGRQAGLACLQQFQRIFFERRIKLTRAYNMVVTTSVNLSAPAALIQDDYLQQLNANVARSKNVRREFQLRVISNAPPRDPNIKDTLSEHALLRADCYLLVVDSLQLLQQLLYKHIKQQVSWNPSAFFMILYHNTRDYQAEDQLVHEIYSLMQQLFVYRVSLLYATDTNLYSFTFLDYFNAEACRTVRWRKFGECRDGIPRPDINAIALASNQFFRTIRTNACSFQLCAAVAAPFVEHDCKNGIELRLLRFLGKVLKIKLNITCETASRGILKANGHWSGLLGKLDRGECDIVTGGFYPDNEVLGSFWYSNCYLQDSHTWFVKRAENRPPWIAMTTIFEVEVWIYFIAVLLVSWLCWYFLVQMLPEPQAHKQLSLAAINAIAVSICVSVSERPYCHASRILFYALTLYGLNFMAIYTSQLILVFTDPGYLYQLQNIGDIMAADIPIGGPAENIDWFENHDDKWIAEHYNDSDLFTPNNDNFLAVVRGERAILSGRMFVMQSNISDQTFAFKDNVFSSPLQFFMKPGIPFQVDVNLLIMYVSDTGVLRKMDNEFRYNNTYLKRIAKMRPHFKDTTIVLTTDHLKGPFFILLVGIIVSCLVFIGELITYYLLMPCWAKLHDTHKSQKKVPRHVQVRQTKHGLEKKHKIAKITPRPWLD